MPRTVNKKSVLKPTGSSKRHGDKNETINESNIETETKTEPETVEEEEIEKGHGGPGRSARDTEMFIFTRGVPKGSEAVLRADPKQIIINPSEELFGETTDKDIEKMVKQNFRSSKIKVKNTEQAPQETDNVFNTRMNVYEAILKGQKGQKEKDVKITKPMSYSRVLGNQLTYGAHYFSKSLKQMKTVKEII